MYLLPFELFFDENVRDLLICIQLTFIEQYDSFDESQDLSRGELLGTDSLT
jgi:hypothetical protein